MLEEISLAVKNQQYHGSPNEMQTNNFICNVESIPEPQILSPAAVASIPTVDGVNNFPTICLSDILDTSVEFGNMLNVNENVMPFVIDGML